VATVRRVNSELIHLSDLRDYLAAHDWSVALADQRRQIWEHRPTGDRLFLPTDEGVDFADLVEIALKTLATIENHQVSVVERRILWGKHDVLRAEWRERRSAIPLPRAIEVQAALLDLVYTSALIKFRESDLGGGAKSIPYAARYMQQVRVLAPTATDLVVLVLPTTPGEGPQDETEVPNEVSDTLLKVSLTAIEIADHGPANRWRNGGPMAPTPEFCRALARICEPIDGLDSSDVDLTIEWARSQEARPDRTVTVERRLHRRFEEAANYMDSFGTGYRFWG
jgi:hypothetical protein